MSCRPSCAVNHANTIVTFAVFGAFRPVSWAFCSSQEMAENAIYSLTKYLWFGLEVGPIASKNTFLSSKERELGLLFFPFQKPLHPSTLLAVILTSPLSFRCGLWAALYCLGNAMNAHLLNACYLPVCRDFSNSACTSCLRE